MNNLNIRYCFPMKKLKTLSINQTHPLLFSSTFLIDITFAMYDKFNALMTHAPPSPTSLFTFSVYCLAAE
jgi:hypothetical protein